MGKSKSTSNNTAQKQAECQRNAILSKQKADREAALQKQRYLERELTTSEEDFSDDGEITLEELGEMVTASTGYEVTIPLYVTAAIDSVEKMRYYFERDPTTGKSRQDPNGRCLNDGSTPLHLAIRSKQLDVVKILVQNGADLSLTDSHGDNILMLAIQSTDANIVNTVWPYKTELDINHMNSEGMSALHLAAEQRWECCLNFLLQNKADPNIQNTKSGMTPLMIAAANGDTKIVENLLRAGAEIILEDFEGFTCLYRAFERKQSDMISYLLKHLPDDERELFIESRLDYIQHPPIPEEEKTFLSEMYIPLLIECTNHRELKSALYNQKAIHHVAYKMEEHTQTVDIVIAGSHLLLCIMFKYGDTVDIRFLRQYLLCKGPDLTMEVTKYYTEVLKMSERSIIAVFLPMIGLAVIPEGRAWITKHYLSVSEYINFFKKDNLKQYIAPNPDFAWCLTKTEFAKIYKVWNRFYDVVTEIQTEQREKNMAELLEQEQREKQRRAKKNQKKKQKKQEKQQKIAENIMQENVVESENLDKLSDNNIVPPCKNENAKTDDSLTYKQNANITRVHIVSTLVEPPFSPVGEQWTTIQNRRNRNKDKMNPSAKQQTVNQSTEEKSKDTRRKKGKKQTNKAIPIPQPQPSVVVPTCDNTTRWADIAKVKPKPADNDAKKISILQREQTESPVKRASFVASDFPSLGGESSERKTEKAEVSPTNERPGTFTFYFHEEPNTPNIHQNNESVWEPSDTLTGDQEITFLGDPVDLDIPEESTINQPPEEWTWENVAAIGEFGRKQYTEVTPDVCHSQNVSTNQDQTYQCYNEGEFGNGGHCVEEEQQTHQMFFNDFEFTSAKSPDQRMSSQNTDYHLDDIDCDEFGPNSNGNDYFDNRYYNTPQWSTGAEHSGCSLSPEIGNGSQGLYHSGNSTPFNDAGYRQTVTNDLAYSDPAIIGFGGLHNDQNQGPRVDPNAGTIPELRQLQTSRFLGNVIQGEDGHHHNTEDQSCRTQKGWSNKRRTRRYDSNPPLSTNNWTFGEKLRQNARDLEESMEMEGVCYPESLRGNKENEQTYFPSFHDDTRLSAQIDPRHFSFVHKLQQMQLAERRDFISKSIKSTQDETLFAYYASCAGLSQQQYYQMIEQMKNNNKVKSRDPLRELIERQQSENQRHRQSNSGDSSPVFSNGGFNTNGMRTTHDTGQGENSENMENTVTNMFNYQSRSMGSKPLTSTPKTPVVHPETLGIPVPEHRPELPDLPPNQSNIYAIQTAQSAMQTGLVNKIRDLFKDMLKEKIKSVRWGENLWNMRNIPVERQMVISKMVIPASESERHYISVSRHDSTVLGLLTDGTEVAIKIIDGQSREFTQQELQYLVDIDVSKYFMVKYKDYCYHDGSYYIATDLYEYTLTEYLHHLKGKKGVTDRSFMCSKLIWQLMRGLESMHQSCLMVHGELKPENVVIDTDGNVRITGYGLSRNIGRDGSFPEYTDEEKCWLSPEVLVHKQKVSFKSDIWVAGMLMYYILSGGRNPFGNDIPNIIWNIGNHGNSIDHVTEEAGHLLKLMMSFNKSERPCISEVLKHPYFWGQEKQLRFIIIAGSDVLRDVKAGVPMSGAVKDSMISIIGTSQCNRQLVNWIPDVEPIVIREMRSFRQYKNNVVELVLFIYNCCTHFETLPVVVREIIDEPCRYFLTKFPTLFMTVYKAIRKSCRAERTCYKAFF